MGNGQSTAPSNSPEPYNGHRFPNVTLFDNVTMQHRLVVEKLKIKKLALVVGWSMGAQQTYQWGCLYPEMVERIAPFCGSAKTSPHNIVFLEGVKAAVTADAAFAAGTYTDISLPKKGLRAVGRVCVCSFFRFFLSFFLSSSDLFYLLYSLILEYYDAHMVTLLHHQRYAGWGLSQAFYQQRLWKDLGFHSLEDFLVGK